MPRRRASAAAAGPPLWRCGGCGRTFANRNQTHTCAVATLSAHFERTPPLTRELFDAFVAEVERCGPVTVLPEKTRIAFHVRMSFAAVMTRRGYLRGHLVLAERHEAACFEKVETFSARNHLHAFVVRSVDEVRALRPFMAMAYGVGRQEHLRARRGRSE